MNLTIDLSEQNAAVLEAQVRAARMPAERYLAQVVARALERQRRLDANNLGETSRRDGLPDRSGDNRRGDGIRPSGSPRGGSVPA